MRRVAGPALAVTGVLLLTGCAADVQGELRRDVAGITDDANARNADGVRRGVEDLLERLDDAVASGELSSPEAARIAELARLLAERADLLAPEVVEEPTEAPTQEPTEPTEEPEEEPDEEPSPSPTPSRTPPPPPPAAPSPTSEPEPEPAPSETLLPEVPTG